MTVSRLDRGTKKDEDDQQQTKAAFQRRALVLNCSGQHRCVLESENLGIVHKVLVKISRKAAKAQRKPQKLINLSRDCLFARDPGYGKCC